jgi:hypothetical protein
MRVPLPLANSGGDTGGRSRSARQCRWRQPPRLRHLRARLAFSFGRLAGRPQGGRILYQRAAPGRNLDKRTLHGIYLHIESRDHPAQGVALGAAVTEIED